VNAPSPAPARTESTVRLCVAVSTIGRRLERFERLLTALATQSDSDFCVGVCDQSTGPAVQELLDHFDASLRLFRTRSAPGLSAGRNSVVAASPVGTTHVAFPNDTTLPPTDFVERIRASASGYDVIVTDYVHDEGSRYRLPTAGEFLTSATVWKVLEPAMVLSRDLWASARGFDEQLGTGSRSRWQSGEGTDLLLRAMKRRPVRVRWMPEIRLDGVPEAFGLSRSQAAAKARGYARGYGFVVARHRYPASFAVPHLLAPAVKAAVHPARWRDLPEAVGVSIARVEGWYGQHRAQQSP
jgi:hypothetical protein